MLVKRSLFMRPASTLINGLSRDESKIFFSRYDEKKIKLSRSEVCKKSKINAALISGYEVTKKEVETPLKVDSSIGVGIIDYFQGKNIFLTGGTGLLGKGLAEKILRSTPVEKIYLLVKADDSEAALARLAKELVNSDLFGCVQQKHGSDYQEFIKKKLIPVVGNICEPNLGMDSETARAIMEDVNVIIESAAITTLNERYDLMLDTNVKGPQRLMTFAKTCKNLEIFVHISTAYVNGEREGVIAEKPVIMGENGPNDDKEILFDISHEINIALKSCTATSDYEITREMKKLGMKRAKHYGWYNTYQLTKAMAEMVVHETRSNIPVLIVRPSIIESCYKEPYPGWIQGNRMLDPLIIAYGKGHLPAYLGNPDTTVDVIPLDMVVNATIAAIAKHGGMGKSELNVYQLASGLVNPLRYSDFFEYIHEYFSSDPLIESESLTKTNYYDNLSYIKYLDNFHDFSKYTRKEIFERLKNEFGVGEKTIQLKIQKQCKAKVAYVEHLCKMYEFLGFFKARFDAGNMQKLLSEMSKEEKMSFPIDVKEISWRKYFQKVHIPGLRKYVLNHKSL